MVESLRERERRVRELEGRVEQLEAELATISEEKARLIETKNLLAADLEKLLSHRQVSGQHDQSIFIVFSVILNFGCNGIHDFVFRSCII